METQKRSVCSTLVRWRFFSNASGLSTLEYAVLFVVILVGGLTVWNVLGSAMSTKVNEGRNRFSAVLSGESLSGGSFGNSIRRYNGNTRQPINVTVKADDNNEWLEQDTSKNGKSKRKAVAGKVIPGEPITNPKVKEILRKAYQQTNPVYVGDYKFEERSKDKKPREQGFTGTEPGFFDWILGNDMSIERWDEGDACHDKLCEIRVPRNLTDGSIKDELIFTAHTHPIEDPEHVVGTKDYNNYIKYFSPAPHYIVAPEGVYRFSEDEDGTVKTEYIGTREDILY